MTRKKATMGSLNLKYWEWEALPFQEKMRALSFKPVAQALFKDETKAYRFTRTIMHVKQKGSATLSTMPGDLPKATWHRYLEYGVQLGMLDKTDGGTYVLTNRLSTPLRRIADYYDKWKKEGEHEEAQHLFPSARDFDEKKEVEKNDRETS
ncbi:MAG TPA: hypothetical protein VGQ00_04505 [Candidatus Norongarragalinales archaeon]|jgi:hypothetical protein|nr:hypothetical protein [Candidatus Norongarragalinales archaeon]